MKEMKENLFEIKCWNVKNSNSYANFGIRKLRQTRVLKIYITF